VPAAPAESTASRASALSAGATGTVVLIDAIGPKELRIPLVLDVLAASDDRGCAVHVVGNLLAANPPLDLGRAIAERRAAVARRLAVEALAQRHDAVGLLDLQGLEGACLRDLAARLRAGLVPRAQTIRAAWRELNAAAAPEDERLRRLFDGLLASSRSAAGRTQLAAELALHEAWRTRTTDLPTAYAAVNRAVECLIELDVPVAITLSGRWRELRNEHAHAAMTVAPATEAIEELAGEIRAALGIDDPAMPWIEALELLGIGVEQREDPALAFVALLAERALRAGPVTADRARSQLR